MKDAGKKSGKKGERACQGSNLESSRPQRDALSITLQAPCLLLPRDLAACSLPLLPTPLARLLSFPSPLLPASRLLLLPSPFLHSLEGLKGRRRRRGITATIGIGDEATRDTRRSGQRARERLSLLPHPSHKSPSSILLPTTKRHSSPAPAEPKQLCPRLLESTLEERERHPETRDPEERQDARQ